MIRGLSILAILILADPALASGVHLGKITPIMVAPVFSSGVLALLVGAFVSQDHPGAGWLAGGAVLVLTIVLSRLLGPFGYIAAVVPQVITGLALLVAWRRRSMKA
jgi:type IV secretory pathway VirB2 component (pilin)